MRNNFGELFEIYSAGTNPSYVHPKSISTMREIGIDIMCHKSKSLYELQISKFDVVITLCDWAKSMCPNLTGKKQTIHWDIHDPSIGNAHTKEKRFAKMRNDLAMRIDRFSKHYILETK